MKLIVKGNYVSYSFLKERGSLKKLDGSIVSGEPGDVMVHYQNGDGDIFPLEQIPIRFVSDGPIDLQKMAKESNLTEIKPPTEDQPPVEPEQAPTEP